MNVQSYFKQLNVNDIEKAKNKMFILYKNVNEKIDEKKLKETIDILINKIRICDAIPSKKTLFIVPYINCGEFLNDVFCYAKNNNNKKIKDEKRVKHYIINSSLKELASCEIADPSLKYLPAEIVCFEILWNFTYFGLTEKIRTDNVNKIFKEISSEIINDTECISAEGISDFFDSLDERTNVEKQVDNTINEYENKLNEQIYNFFSE